MELTDYNEIQALLERNGFRFSRSMGQNFLVEPWVPEKIAENASLDKNTAVLEIGPGVGCLTEQLSLRADRVLAVETDRSLAPVLAETLAECPNVEFLYGDILKQDIPALIRSRFGEERTVVCANIPYNITSPLLTALLKAGCFGAVTVMIQREVARRICAWPGTAEYGAFSLLAEWYAESEILFDVPPDCFYPRPKVTSSVIRLTPRSAPPYPVSDEGLLFRVIRGAFNQRRKTLANALSSALGTDRSAVTDILGRCGIDPTLRGETLPLEAFVKIAEETAQKQASETL